MKRVFVLLFVFVFVFVGIFLSYSEARAEALSASLALGSTAVAGEAAAVLTVLAAAGIVAVTAVGAYVLYSYVKSKFSDSYVYNSSNNTIILKNVDFINDLRNNSVVVSKGDTLWAQEVTFYADKLGTGEVYELCTLPMLPTGSYWLVVEALVVGGDFTTISGITPCNLNACIYGNIDVGGYVWTRLQGVQLTLSMNVLADTTGYYVNGARVTNQLKITDYIGSKYYSSGYPTCTGYGATKLRVSVRTAADVTATAGRDYVLNQGKDIAGYIDKPIAVDVPSDGTLDLEKLKDMYYVPALRDTSISAPADATTDINPPADVPTDRIEPPSLDLPQIITQKFPFSLPWDLQYLLSIFVQPPEKPVFDFNFKLLGMNIPLHLDFSLDEDFMFIVRKLEFFAFVVLLLIKTPTLLKGGDN